MAAKFGPQRAIYYADDQGRVEKFRPYALPTPPWVRNLAAGAPADREEVGMGEERR
jgi:hypothetical protein